jgi:hypothetical protein
MATSGTLSIKLRCASWQQLATIYQRDLIRGTMFLRSATPPALGTVIRISMALPSGSMIEMTGVVERQVTDQRGSGVELQLAPLADGAVWMIESALEAEQRRGTHASPSMGVAVAPPVAPAPPAPVASMGDGAEVTSAETDLVRALLAEVDAMKKLNPFLVLGIGYEASDVEVRRAFGELTKRYHPDRFARYESSELRHVAAEIFILIRDAYRKLCDETGRVQALSSLGRSRSPAPVPRLGGAAEARRPTAAQAQPAPHMPATVQLPPAAQPPTAAPVPAAPRGTPAPPPRTPPAAPLETAEILALEELLDQGRLDEALGGYRSLVKKYPHDRTLRAGIELCEGLLAMALRDRTQAAQRFETALEIDPSNERAARELADMRRQATNERKGLLSRLMGKPEAKES